MMSSIIMGSGLPCGRLMKGAARAAAGESTFREQPARALAVTQEVPGRASLGLAADGDIGGASAGTRMS